MKRIYTVLVAVFLLISTISQLSLAQCPPFKIVGSNVGINTLTDAVALGIITMSGNTVAYEPFCINGIFDVNNPNITFEHCNIQFYSNSRMNFNSNTSVNLINNNIFMRVPGHNNSKIDFNSVNLVNIDEFGSDLNDIQFFSCPNVSLSDVLFAGDIYQKTSNVNIQSSNFYGTEIYSIDYSNFIMEKCTLQNLSTGSAIRIELGGTFYGKNNYFFNVSTPLAAAGPVSTYFTQVESYNSKIDFGSSLSHGQITVSGVNHFIYEDNLHIGTTSLSRIRSVNSGQVSIKNNNYDTWWIDTGNNTNLFIDTNTTSGYISGGLSNNGFIRWNVLNMADWPIGSGILTETATNYKIISNNVNGYVQNNILDRFGNSNEIRYNTSKGALSGIRSENNLNDLFQCNTIELATNGLVAEGSNGGLSFQGNTMKNNSTGLVYRPGALAPPQINKGNIFIGNSLGAEFQGSPMFLEIISARYEVRNLASEFPTHTPINWFNNNAPWGYSCLTAEPDPDPWEPDLALRVLIECAGDESHNGNCFIQLQQALQLIGQHPEVLDDEEIWAFYQDYSGSFIHEFPTIHQLMESLSDNMPKVDFFSMDMDSETFESIATRWNDFIPEAKAMVAERRSHVDSWTAGNLAVLEQLSPASEIEEALHFVTKKYILLQNSDTVNDDERNQIVSIAEGCISDFGPAVYIARGLASNYDLEYAERMIEDCTGGDVIPKKNIDLATNVLEVYPNPASNTVRISGGGSVVIRNIVGNILFIGKADEQNVDISTWANGVYFIQSTEGQTTLKLIKID